MQFGIVLPSYLPEATVDGMRRTALLAEALGYDSVWSTDHVMMSMADVPSANAVSGQQPAYRSIFEAVSILSWLAGLTTRVKLGISVLIMGQRHPVIVAKEIATIDAISGGRVILGVGAGWSAREFAFLNADFHQRGKILDEGIQVLRSLWSTPEEPFHGRYFGFERQAFGPPPAQTGGPPIWIGGDSDAAMRRAARLGDAWHVGSSGAAPDVVARYAARLAAARDDRDVAITLRSPVRERRGEYPSSKGPVYVMGGGVEELRTDVQRYRDAGCSHIVLNFWTGDLQGQLDAITRFAEGVIPYV